MWSAKAVFLDREDDDFLDLLVPDDDRRLRRGPLFDELESEDPGDSADDDDEEEPEDADADFAEADETSLTCRCGIRPVSDDGLLDDLGGRLYRVSDRKVLEESWP